MAKEVEYEISLRVRIHASSEFIAIKLGADEMRKRLNTATESNLSSVGLEVDLVPWTSIDLNSELT